MCATTANEICCAWLFVIQKKALAKSRSRDILHWMEIRLEGCIISNCTRLWWFEYQTSMIEATNIKKNFLTFVASTVMTFPDCCFTRWTSACLSEKGCNSHYRHLTLFRWWCHRNTKQPVADTSWNTGGGASAKGLVRFICPLHGRGIRWHAPTGKFWNLQSLKCPF